MALKEKRKELFIEFARNEDTLPITMQPWWLDSLCKSKWHWDVCIYKENSEIIAVMPYTYYKVFGLRIIKQPALMQFLGPWFKESQGSTSRCLSQQKKASRELISQIPCFFYFSQSWNWRQQYWLPFYWAGFNQNSKITYIVKDLQSVDRIESLFTSSYRNKAKNASRILTVKENLDAEEFWALHSAVFSRQAIQVPYTYEYFFHHHQKIQENNSGRIFYAHDEAGQVHSALYLTWDKKSSYVHMVGEDPTLRNSGAGILLIKHAMEYSKIKLSLNYFDFEGSMIEAIEVVRRDSGAQPVGYNSIKKINLGIFSFLRRFFK